MAELEASAEHAELEGRAFNYAVREQVAIGTRGWLFGWPLIQRLNAGIAFTGLPSSSIKLRDEWTTLAAALQQSWAELSMTVTNFEVLLPTPDTALAPSILSVPLLIALAAVALIVWLAGNALLLRGLRTPHSAKEAA